ncbi:MAG: FAD-binding oxidoreductase, partial [Deltaproteobacteria bacterium]|nr:FAD-binding oxidoreductase [Deltaproteobacteria bacterium]
MKLTGWGRYPWIKATGVSFETPEELAGYLKTSAAGIVHGLGRSYGDSALYDHVIFSRRFNKIIRFDDATGVVTAESGVTLAEIIETFLPRGWFLKVTPGTKFITLGGAIASDVHGKNHHQSGCFSECVLYFDLMLPGGNIVRCSRDQNRDLFLATCGGMGLTGVVLAVAFRLQPVKSAFIRETVVRCHNLHEVIDLFEENKSISYSVAWIDCLARGDKLGRSVLMLGEHAETGRKTPPPHPSWSIPINLPGFCLNQYSVSWFNHFYYLRQPEFVSGRLVHLDPFFYPLDKINQWNRMYGRHGFTQYQFVLPKAAGRDGLGAILSRISAAGLGSFLAVLKLLGPANENLLSFPLEGYTLAL